MNETCEGVRKNTMLLSLSFALSLKSFEKCAFTFAMLTEVMANYNEVPLVNTMSLLRFLLSFRKIM